MREALTEIQAEVLQALRKRRENGQSPPTYRDLCADFGWASTGTARDHLRALVRKGYVELGSRRHRQVRLCEEPPVAGHVPVIGRVEAGLPILAEENFEGWIPVPANWLDHQPHFALQVSGNSMVGAGILEGDCVIVRQQVTADDGEIVVATVDGATTLKRIQRRGKRTALVAENPLYSAIEILTDSATIHGVVVGLLRAFLEGSVIQPSTGICHGA